MIKKAVLSFLAMLFAVVLFSICVSAEEADYADSLLTVEGFEAQYLLSDGNERTHTAANDDEGGSVTVTREDGISFLYIVFDRIPEEWTLSDISGDTQAVCGENSYLHEYVNVEEKLGDTPESVRLDFPAGTSIDEIYAFGEGDIPDWVQRWSPPCEEADLLLLSSHSDDEQLFFAGVLPIYAGERGLQVQVVYLVDHFYNTAEYERLRPHEQLDGLWTVGVRNYPVMSGFPDLYSESLDEALAAYGWYGFEYEDFTEFITGVLRRFKPLVVVSHDVNGEYGHGTHVLCAAALMDSLGFAADETVFPESAEQYGVWETEKAYLHLYPENPLTLDLDSPLEAFDGKTAFQVTQDGFSKHESQHWTWFYGWIYGKNGQITQATEIRSYSPCYYGLYSTAVGLDTEGGDFMENVKTYAQRHAEEQAAMESEAAEKEPEITTTTATETEAADVAIVADTTDVTDIIEINDGDEQSDRLLPVLVVIAAAVICVIAVSIVRRKK